MTFARGLRWTAFVAALVGVVLVALDMTAWSQTAPSDAPIIGLDVLKPRFLSTEQASGSLVVRNTTPERLRYNPFDTLIVVRGDDGKTTELPSITTIRTIGMSPEPIEPGATRTFPVMLPKCGVIEDPCDVHVTLNVALATDKRSFQVRTPERSYTFVADPQESFEESGSRSAPIVIARAEIEAALPQNIVDITFHYREASDGDEIARILTARHLGIGSSTSATADGFDDVRSFNDSDSDTAIDAALSEIEAKPRYGRAAALHRLGQRSLERTREGSRCRPACCCRRRAVSRRGRHRRFQHTGAVAGGDRCAAGRSTVRRERSVHAIRSRRGDRRLYEPDARKRM
jgi:hypothetical protein